MHIFDEEISHVQFHIKRKKNYKNILWEKSCDNDDRERKKFLKKCEYMWLMDDVETKSDENEN